MRASLQGESPDRMPLALWRRFPLAERSPQDLAAATWAFAQELGLDLVRLAPSDLYAIEGWGAEVVYPRKEEKLPTLKRWVIQEPHQWLDLLSLDLASGALGREMQAIRELRTLARGQTPFVMTVFSPLTVAYKLAGDAVLEHLRRAPKALHFGLAIIAETMARVARQALAQRADGLFFITQLASSAHLTREEYETFGVHYDLMVLDPLRHTPAITVLHLHGPDPFFDLVNRYPVQAVNWNHHTTGPSLAEARRLTDKTLLGGLDRDLLREGPAQAIADQVRQVVREAGSQRFILAPSRIPYLDTPQEHFLAVREALHSLCG
ncbi:MAG: hypothetical protein GX605_06995 [Chloroflexi bacterium]|nr:hypothetical protein [Chloroflexota bacterium]